MVGDAHPTEEINMSNGNSRSISSYTESIKIYETTYQLPILTSPDFARIQENIQVRQQLIKQGK
jgi:hypothetical protein